MIPAALGGGAAMIAKAAFAYAAPKLVKAVADKFIDNDSDKKTTAQKKETPVTQNTQIELYFAQKDDQTQKELMNKISLYSPGSKLSETGKNIANEWTGGAPQDDIKLTRAEKTSQNVASSTWKAGALGDEDVRLT
jgi:hypothetical protein